MKIECLKEIKKIINDGIDEVETEFLLGEVFLEEFADFLYVRDNLLVYNIIIDDGAPWEILYHVGIYKP